MTWSLSQPRYVLFLILVLYQQKRRSIVVSSFILSRVGGGGPTRGHDHVLLPAPRTSSSTSSSTISAEPSTTLPSSTRHHVLVAPRRHQSRWTKNSLAINQRYNTFYQSSSIYQQVDPSFLEQQGQQGEFLATTTSNDVIEINNAVNEKGGSSSSSSSLQRKYETFLWNRTATTNYSINYRVEGQVGAPPILLVHGFGANVNHFRFQFPSLIQAGYRVYAIDLLGFGASDKPSHENYSIELKVQLLCDFIQYENEKMIHTTSREQQQDTQQQQHKTHWFIAGNSIGGLCSLGVAQQLPTMIGGVILFNCAGGMTGFRYEDVSWYLKPILFFIEKVILGPIIGGYFFRNFKTRTNVENILRQQGVYMNQTNVNDQLIHLLLEPSEDSGAEQVFLATFAGPPGPTPESILPNITCPILALWGEKDPWTPLDTGAHPGSQFIQYVPDPTQFTLDVLPNVGHCPHDERPDLVNPRMITWMNTIVQKW